MSFPSAPAWLLEAEAALHADLPDWFTRFAPPEEVERRSAVLMLVAPGEEGHDIVLTERASHLRSHAGQVSFPGGRLDPGEGPVDAALRETWEEIGVGSDAIDVVGSFPDLWLGPSENAVTPVMGWWSTPSPLHVVNPHEVARVERVPLDVLADPANRFMVKGPSGYVGPGFEASGLFVWGFTAQLLSVFLDAAGMAQPWDEGRRRRLPWRFVRPYVMPGGRRPTRG